MGWFDDMVGKARRRAQQEAARYAAKKAQDTARRTVEAVAGDFLEFAEKELEGAKRRREDLTRDDQDDVRAVEAAAREARRKAREDRERQAREELEKLKAEAWAKSRKARGED